MRNYLHIPIMSKALGFLFVGWMLILQVEAQPVVRIQPTAGCDGFDLMVPIEVEDFLDIAAFTLYIQVDTARFDFLGVENLHESLSSGQLVSNLVSGKLSTLILSWTGNSAAEIQNGVLCNIKVHLKSAPATFVLNENSELAHSDFTVITNVVYHSGAIEAWDSFTPEPELATVNEGQSVSFVLPALSSLSYQWQLANDAVWNDLSDGVHFQGTQTSELHIVDAPLSYHNARFRCLLFTQHCSQTSHEATLTVNTLGFGDTESQAGILQVYPNPFDNQLGYKTGEAIRNGRIQLTDMQGKIWWQSELNRFSAASYHRIPLDDLREGVYVLSLFQDNKMISTNKVIKKN